MRVFRSSLFGFGVVLTLGVYRHRLHALGGLGLIAPAGGGGDDGVGHLHALDDLAEGGIAAVQVRGILMHDKEVWSRKAAYLLDILSLLEFVDNKLTTIFVLKSTE